MDIVSLDTETTGLRDTSKIWSVGIYGKNLQYEKFSDPRQNPTNSTDGLIDFLIEESKGYGSSNFAEEQHKRGSFNDLLESIRNGTTSTERELAFDSFENLKNSAILIQNANFENTMLSRAIKGENDPLKHIFRYNSEYARNKNKKLYTPPEVTNIRGDIENLRKNNGNIGEISSHYKKMMEAYSNELNKTDGKSFVIELQDITRATMAMAENKGLIQNGTYDANSSIEFLVDIFLNKQKEQHTALSDAKQQYELYHKFMGIQQQIESDNIPKATQLEFLEYSKKAGEGIRKRFERELHNIKKEIESENGFRLIPDVPDKIRKVTIKETGGKAHFINVPIYEVMEHTKDINVAVEHILKRYKGKIPLGNVEEIVKTFNEKTSTDNKINVNLSDYFNNEKASLNDKSAEGQTINKINDIIENNKNKIGLFAAGVVRNIYSK